jgi:hypothetical protein
MKKPTLPPSGPRRPGYCTRYVNRWGQLMVAADYGYRCWRFTR